MVEKTGGKKEQQKQNKKQNEKKKQNQNQNVANGVKHSNPRPNPPPQKKKEKSNKTNSKPQIKKKSGSFLESIFLTVCYSLVILTFLYLVDYEKFCQIRNWYGSLVNKTVSLLPAEAVAKGRQVIELVRPAAEVTANKLGAMINETSSFLNTNPLVKDHWANVRDIGSICGARLVDYMRTLYLQVTGFYQDFKSKLI